ncbi:MAG: HD domain-containing protein [Bdellovibrio sp.]|nr:HD domain-containing protein [Bdellovibrio sp.]
MSSTELIAIKKLQDKDPIQDRAFLVKDKVKGMGKNGRPFLSLLIGDKTGHIDARVWDRVEEIADTFDTGDIVIVKGQVQVYLNRKQIVVHRLEKADQSAFNKDEFTIAGKKVDAHAHYSELIQIVNQLKSPPIKQILLDSLQDEEIKNLMLKSPAAKTIHHAWSGGLLEHIVSICRLMKMMASHYTFVNYDLLVFGAIFHDLGKIWELEINNDFIQYTQKGRLLGHMQLACELIDRKAARILGFPEDLKDILKHIILSHHGKLEYGSPKRPKFMEAMIVAMIDDLDSKINTVQTFIDQERETGESWSRYNEGFERYFFLENLKDRWT